MAPSTHIQNLVKTVAERVRENKVTVAVVGDMILDNAIEGVPGGRHPDIGVPILKEATFQESTGGAANIALALSRLGVEVALFGVIGSDLPGRQLENLLDRQTFAHHFITERGWPTPRKDWIYHRQEGRQALTLRIDYDRPLEGRAREELVGEFRARCPSRVDVVILADHGLGNIGPESLALVGLAKERQAKLVAIPRTKVFARPTSERHWRDQVPEIARHARSGTQGRRLILDPGRAMPGNISNAFLTLLEEGIVTCPAGAVEGTLHKGFPLENAHWMGLETSPLRWLRWVWPWA